MPNGARNYCFTLNNYDHSLRYLRDRFRYLCFGFEVGSSGTPHLQGYVSLRKKETMGQLHKIIGWERTALLVAKGTARENRDYCSKGGDSQFVEFGTPPESGAESTKRKWDEARRCAQEGRFDDVPSDVYIKHFTNLKKINLEHRQKAPKVQLDDVCGLWIVGEPGVGKSYHVHHTYPDAYLKMQNKWWDGYQEQDIVYMEDLDLGAKVLGHHIKLWSDRYEFTAECKGFSLKIRPKRFIVTSNYRIEHIFADDLVMQEAILRRFEHVRMHPDREIRKIE